MKIIQILGTCALVMATHSWAVKDVPNPEQIIAANAAAAAAKLVDEVVEDEEQKVAIKKTKKKTKYEPSNLEALIRSGHIKGKKGKKGIKGIKGIKK